MYLPILLKVSKLIAVFYPQNKIDKEVQFVNITHAIHPTNLQIIMYLKNNFTFLCRFSGGFNQCINGHRMENHGGMVGRKCALQDNQILANGGYVLFDVRAGRSVHRPLRCHHASDELLRKL